MGHLFLLCGPPGAGKTTLLKRLEKDGVQIRQLKRLTTRKPRKEEGDIGVESLEYYFRTNEQFAERLSKGEVANLIEWNSNYYSTQHSELDKVKDSNTDYILLEDIPSAIALKENLKTDITVVFIFTIDKEEMLNNLDFASYENNPSETLSEWRRRLALKYDNSEKLGNHEILNPEKEKYISEKIRRSIPDLAFIVGKIRDGLCVEILPNRKDGIEETVRNFKIILNNRNQQLEQKVISSNREESIDPSKLKIGFILRSMTPVQFWKTLIALFAILSAVATCSFWLGKTLNNYNQKANKTVHSTTAAPPHP